MKVMFISDIHGSYYWANRAIEKYHEEKADKLIILGDILYHGPRNDLPKNYNCKKVIALLNPLKKDIIAVRGNCDSEVDTLVLDMPIQAPYTYVVAEGLKIVTTHGHYVETDEAKDKMAKALKADIFISGHVHINVLEKRGNTVFLNPGSPSLSKREDNRATVAVLEDKTIKIIDIDTDEVIMTLTL